MATRQQQLAAIMTAESGGRNVNNQQGPGGTPASSASGYYQMIDSTWQQSARWAGIDTTQYPRAINAPFDVQTQAANALIDHQGLQPWAGSRANSLINQIDSGQSPRLVYGPTDGSGTTQIADGTPGGGFGDHPVVTTGPDGIATTTVTPNPSQTAGGGTGNTAAGAGASAPGYLPPSTTGGPFAFGLVPGLAAAVQSDVASTQQTAQTIATGAETATGNAFRTAWAGALGAAENWVERWFLVIAAIAIIALALWRIMDPSGDKLGGFVRKAA
jgi:hypothetical protein